MPHWCSARPCDEVQLFRQVRRAYPELDYASLTAAPLGEITREHGVDFATALLFDRVRRSPEHGPFIEETETLEPDLNALPTLSGSMLVAPGAFYREYPELGGDGLLFREVAERFGLTSAMMPIPGACTVSEGAARVRARLQQEERENIVLISMSKGGADVRLALASDERAARKVGTWINICGLLRGSPAVDDLLSGSPLHRGAIRAYLRWNKIPVRLMEELRRGPGSLLSAPLPLPPGLRVINVVGFPLTSHLTGTPNMRRRHMQMASVGPNDGSTLLLDAIMEPGLIYPVWGVDHCFRSPSLSLLVYRLFLYLDRQGILPRTMAYASVEK